MMEAVCGIYTEPDGQENGISMRTQHEGGGNGEVLRVMSKASVLTWAY